MPRLLEESPLTPSRKMANHLAHVAEGMGLLPMSLLLIGDGRVPPRRGIRPPRAAPGV